MSYEYLIRFNNQESMLTFEKIKNSSFCNFYKNKCIHLRDDSIESTWAYDVRMFYKNPQVLFLEITNLSKKLSDEIKESLYGRSFSIYEDGDEEKLTLNEVLKG